MRYLKHIGAAALLAACVSAAWAGQQATKQATVATPTAASSVAEIGKPFRDFALRDIASDSGKTVKLSDFKGKKVFVGVFMANRCGTTWTYEEQIGKLLKDYQGKDVQIAAIHANFRETNQEIMGQIEQRNLAMPVLDDKKTQGLADYVKADCTPTFFVVDKAGVLRYKGAFDRYHDESKSYLRPALDAVLAGQTVKTPETRAFG